MTFDLARLPEALRDHGLAARIRVAESGCWLWTGARTAAVDGYGQVRRAGRLQVVHRVVYEIRRGPVPPGLQLDHLCRVRLCVNPAHLEPVTPRSNVLRSEGMAARRARRARQTHCHRGHPLAGDNLRIERSGARRCRQCRRERERVGP